MGDKLTWSIQRSKFLTTREWLLILPVDALISASLFSREATQRNLYLQESIFGRR